MGGHDAREGEVLRYLEARLGLELAAIHEAIIRVEMFAAGSRKDNKVREMKISPRIVTTAPDPPEAA
jgi:hypothetical protein